MGGSPSILESAPKCYTTPASRGGGLGTGSFYIDLDDPFRLHRSDPMTRLSEPPRVSDAPSRQMCLTKLQTLKKKMSRLRRRAGHHQDFRKQFREFVSTWNYRQLHALRQEYEALSVLHELTVQALSARPHPSSLKIDMAQMFDSGLCADVQIAYQGTVFDVHRALLSARCPFFQMRFCSWFAKPDVTHNSARCLVHPPAPPPPIPIDIDGGAAEVDRDMFTCLIKFLYTGSVCIDVRLDKWDTLSHLLGQQFGMPNSLEDDMARLLKSAIDIDCVLVFTHTSLSHKHQRSVKAVHSSNHTVEKDTTRSQDDQPVCRCSDCTSDPVSPENQRRQLPCSHHYRRHHTHAPTPQHHNQMCHHSNRIYNRQRDGHSSPPPFEVHCHRSILAARSRFLRHVIERRSPRDPMAPLRLVLDEWIVPRRLAMPLLHCLYTDQLDLSLVGKTPTSNSPPPCGSPPSQPLPNPLADPFRNQGASTDPSKHQGAPTDPTRPPSSLDPDLINCEECLRDVMELYQIGQFLEFPLLSYKCEDVLISSLSLTNVLSVLRWSTQPHGSQLVHRHTVHFLTQNFLNLSHSPILFDLQKEELATLISSHFLQARESDVLNAVIRWGEHRLIRSMEEKEPSLLAHSPHSSKKGIKRKDLNDKEVYPLIADLMPLVRLEHVLPAQADHVHAAIKRGFVPHPPTLYMLQTPSQAQDRVACWCRSPSERPPRLPMASGVPLSSLLIDPPHHSRCLSYQISESKSSHSSPTTRRQSPSFLPPRLFTPFYDEVKSLLMEQYKVSWLDTPSDTSSRPPLSREPMEKIPSSFSSSTTLLDANMINAVRKRAKDLEQHLLVQRALLMPCTDREDVCHQVQLKAIREAGLPDSALHLPLLPLPSPPPISAPLGWISPGHRCPRKINSQRFQESAEQFPAPLSPLIRHPTDAFTPECSEVQNAQRSDNTPFLLRDIFNHTPHSPSPSSISTPQGSCDDLSIAPSREQSILPPDLLGAAGGSSQELQSSHYMHRNRYCLLLSSLSRDQRQPYAETSQRYRPYRGRIEDSDSGEYEENSLFV